MKKEVLVCCGPGCAAAGSFKIAERLKAAAAVSAPETDIICEIESTGCSGMCELGPLVRIMPDDVMYYKVKPSDAEDIIQKTVLKGEIIERLCFKTEDGTPVVHQNENPFYSRQTKVALRNTGLIDPKDIDAYISRGGYEALKKALTMTPDEIIEEVTLSGIRGRGGAGFPTGRKWRSAASIPVETKYVICNGDEGDHGAFMGGAL